MHCPRCGQQQISDATKFCSRCGFQLGLVAELLENNGFLPQLEQLYTANTGWFTRRNGVVFSVFWFMLFVLILTPLFGIADIEELAGISAILGVFGGLMLLIGSLVLLKSPPKAGRSHPALAGQAVPATLYGTHNQPALPPQQSQPASTYAPPGTGAWRAPDTGDLARPGSVTEGTTKLLRKEEENT